MIHSYIMDNKFEKINRLLDQFCQICSKNALNSCEGCNLSHRKNNVCIPFVVAPEMEEKRLNIFADQTEIKATA